MALNHSHAIGLGRKRAVGVFPNLQTAEQALQALRDSGFAMDRVSVIARDSGNRDRIAGADVSDHVGNKADEGATTGALSGGAVGGLTGLLVGLGLLAIPGIGPVMLAGAGATALATTLAGGAIGAAAGGLIGALIGLGIPEERARVYNDRVARGDYLVIVDGTQDEVLRAERILKDRGIQEWGIYDANEVSDRPNAAVAPVVDTPGPTPSRPLVSDRPSTAVVDTPAPMPSRPMAATDRPITAAESGTIPLHEERLVVDKDRVKTGEVAIGKHIETETARANVPVEKEQVIIERVSSPEIGRAATPGEAAFQTGEAVRMDVYEETPEIHKEAFVREEVNVRKEVQQDMVKAEETLRREELDVNAPGIPVRDVTTDPQEQCPSDPI